MPYISYEDGIVLLEQSVGPDTDHNKTLSSSNNAGLETVNSTGSAEHSKHL